MTNSIWEIAANTPWWVYALFFYLARVGLQATRPRIMPIRRMLILPILFIAVSFYSMYNNMQLTPSHIALWTSALVLGSVLGWLQFKTMKIQAIKNSTSLYMPGTWSLLVIILGIFAIKYYSGYQNTIDPATMHSKPWLFFVYGIFTGLFVGRTTYAVRRIKAGPYAPTNLVARVS